eukprot:GDKI01009626.1.p1 GENE.GDKI01009626.1~~GDKI01009626.1.p1  ORF type:complete len:192 (-),score=32.77 GDKI01009626.1:214-789(-)
MTSKYYGCRSTTAKQQESKGNMYETQMNSHVTNSNYDGTFCYAESYCSPHRAPSVASSKHTTRTNTSTRTSTVSFLDDPAIAYVTPMKIRQSTAPKETPSPIVSPFERLLQEAAAKASRGTSASTNACASTYVPSDTSSDSGKSETPSVETRSYVSSRLSVDRVSCSMGCFSGPAFKHAPTACEVPMPSFL